VLALLAGAGGDDGAALDAGSDGAVAADAGPPVTAPAAPVPPRLPVFTWNGPERVDIVLV